MAPERAPQRVGQERVDHAVEKTGGCPRVARSARGPGAGVGFKKSGVRGERRRLGLGFSAGCGRGVCGGFGGEPRGAVGVVLGFFRGIVGDVFGPSLADAGEARCTRERGRTEPSFHRRATDGAVDDADWYVEFLKQIAREKIADRRESTDGFRCGDFPAGSFYGVCRSGGDGLRDTDVADERETCARDLGRRAIDAGVGLPRARACIDGEFHVGLAGAEPDFADDHVGNPHRVFPRDDEIGARDLGWERIEQHNPTAIFRGRSGVGLPGKRHGDFLARISAAPDWYGLVALQHGVIGKQRREYDLGAPSGRDERQQRE